jgi:uncharacterized protein YndB with AHSA1/START domain
MTAAATATGIVVVERMMPHPRKKLWHALTQGPLTGEWLMQNDFQPVFGHRFNLRGTPMRHWTAWSTAKFCWSGSTGASTIAAT